MYPKNALKVLAGCAPCQPFSTLATKNRKFQAESDGQSVEPNDKWGLLEQFARLVEEVDPELVTMENVPRVSNHAPYKHFIATLTRLGYSVDARRIKCADYGLPQIRRRFVLVASKFGQIRLPPPLDRSLHRSVHDAIGHLPTLSAGQTDPQDAMHKARSMTEVNLRRIQASRAGGTWEDWPVELRSACHQRDTGKSFRSVYARMEWAAPAPTITTQCFNFGTGRFGHPTQDRAITLREAALLQSFPIDYKFVEPEKTVHFTSVGRMIGNAVPPLLGKLVGTTLQNHLRERINCDVT